MNKPKDWDELEGETPGPVSKISGMILVVIEAGSVDKEGC